MIWIAICQGLVFLTVLFNLLMRVIYALKGRPKAEPAGAAGVLGVCIGIALQALVLWRAGAFSTMLP